MKPKTLQQLKQEHKEMFISLLSFEHFKNLYDNYSDELNYSLGVSDYIIRVANDLVNSDEYKKAEEFSISNGSNRLWDYFHITYGECLDWYLLDKARTIIWSDYPRIAFVNQ